MPKAKPKQKGSRLKQNILTVAIAIIFAFFVGYGVDTFYESPKWEDFCNQTYREILNPNNCEQAGGKWHPYTEKEMPQHVLGNVTGWCDSYYSCQKEFEKVNEVYNRNVFIVCLIAGMIAIIVGGVILSLESVSSGIMGGGVLTVIYGTLRYWGEMSKYIRFVILGLVLAVLIWIGYKKFKQ
jgi:hypothetical protein